MEFPNGITVKDQHVPATPQGPDACPPAAAGLSQSLGWDELCAQILLGTASRLRQLTLAGAFTVRRVATSTAGELHVLCSKPGALQEGPTWIFFHGFAVESFDWAPLANGLLPLCQRMLLLTLPGHGANARPDVHSTWWTPDGINEAVSEVLQHLLRQDERCVLVSHSMGSLVMLSQAARLRGRMDAAIFIAPLAPLRDGNDLTFLRTNFTPRSLADSLRFSDRMIPRAKYSILRLLTALVAGPLMRQPHLLRLIEMISDIPQFEADYLAHLPRTLLVVDPHDAFLPANSWTQYGDHLIRPGDQISPLHGCGHCPHISHTADVVAVIHSWWRATTSLAKL